MTPSFKTAAVQMPKFHALSIIQDQLRGSGMNLIPCVCDLCECVCVCVRARACVRAWVGGWVLELGARVCVCVCVWIVRSYDKKKIWTVTINFCLLKAEVKR